MDTSQIVQGDSFATRATSSFPLSIGTAIAFETLFAPRQPRYDDSRSPPAIVDVGLYQSCWINLATLFRNLTSSVKPEVFARASVAELVSVIEEEIEVIESLFQNEGRGQCKPKFYQATYKTLEGHLPLGVKLRVPSTEKQKFYFSQWTDTINRIHQHTDSHRVFKDAVNPGSHDHSLMLTHFPYDLTDFESFGKLDLLESHSGIVKPRALWNTKYNPMSGQSLSHLPFFRKLLMVFGDKTLIQPGPTELRKAVLETSINRQWHSATTLTKVKFDMDLDIRDPYMMAVWKAL